MRNPKWLVIILVISLAANLALGGFVIGRMSHGGPAPAMMDPSLSLFRVMRALPEERREAFRPTVRKHFRGMRGELRDMRSAQRGINDALQQEPFDPGALERALTDFRAALVESQRENHALLVRVAGSMTAEERDALRQAMIRRGPHFRDGHRRDHDGRGGERGDGPADRTRRAPEQAPPQDAPARP